MERDVPFPHDGRARVVVAGLSPRVEGAAVKRCEDDVLAVRATMVADGHDRIAGVLRYRLPGTSDWKERPLVARPNDVFSVELALGALGRWELAVEGWIDACASYADKLARKLGAADVVDVDLEMLAVLLREAAARADAKHAGDAHALRDYAIAVANRGVAPLERARAVLSRPVVELASRYADRSHATRSTVVPIDVEPAHARFSAWYELFPRSTGSGVEHGTFKTAESWIPYVASMGFDVVYLPPIHPIGRSFRKGRNNTETAGPGDPGSPWAIGGSEGGHTAIHPALGTLHDFDRFVARAGEHGLRVALDVAFQASPDHPWVKEHPEWFQRRPDGSIQYAENPPKKYQDVYPLDFESDAWRELWTELRDVFLFWIDRGITLFRVDNPHTKPIRFWEWCITSIKARHPEVTFLSEAFTRPELMYALARAGFSQGYTYFTWRHTKWELRSYLEEITRPPIAEFFRPSLWPNTPDILPDDLQHGGRGAFLARLVLAATLSGHYGIYGPAFELMEHVARPDSGEYQDNEKFEIKAWDLEAPSLRPVIAAINAIRREHPALQRNDTLRFFDTDNERILGYAKQEGEDIVLVVVSLDPHHKQSGWVTLDLEALRIDPTETFQAHDLLGGGRYLWSGARNFVELDPHAMPAQIFALRRRVRRERDFDYFL